MELIFYSSCLCKSYMHSLLNIVATTPSFKVSMSQMVYQEKNDNGWKLHGFLLLTRAWKGTDWYTTNNENIILIVIQHKLQMKQTANFRLAVSTVAEITSFMILRTKGGDLPLIPTTLHTCGFYGYLINVRCHFPGIRKEHDNLGISLNASWCT